MFVDETKIFYVNGIPVTFPSIVEWWEQYSNKVPFRQRRFRDPHMDERACWEIANAIVKELQDKIGGNFGYTFSGSDEKETKVEQSSVLSSHLEDPDTAGLDWLNHNDVVNKAFEILEKKWREKREEENRLREERAKFWNYQQQKNKQQKSEYDFSVHPKPFNWRTVLGFTETDAITEEAIKKNYRKEAMKRHPDHGGTSEQINELFKARDAAYIFIGKQPP